MKKLVALMAVIVVIFTIGVTFVNAASIEKICEDRCSHYTEPETFGPCFNDCMREYEN